MKLKPEDTQEYVFLALLQREDDKRWDDDIIVNESLPLKNEKNNERADALDTTTPDDVDKENHDKTTDVIFLDASKSKSDCVILDIVPSAVEKVHCVLFDDSVTPNHNAPTDVESLSSPTDVKPYVDTISLSEPCCRVCHCNGDEHLISPCDCSGSVKWVHETCLVKWMKSSFKESCELCRREIEITKRRKPLAKWKLPSQRPTPVLWVLVFITAIALNLASVVKDASRECSSTPCIVFYAVGCIGVVLGTLFLIYWSKRAKHFINQWLEQNEEWVVLLENMEKRDGRYSSTNDVVANSTDVRT